MSADADDLLRETVERLAGSYEWAGIFFVEGDVLVLGPSAGEPDESRRVTVPVTWRGDRIAELAVDGDLDAAALEPVAAEIAELCLVGWDTGGAPWEP